MKREVPAADEVLSACQRELDVAYRALGDASDRLRADWPGGSGLTTGQVEARARMIREIAAAKAAINRAR